jgi:WD40 repeat protein
MDADTPLIQAAALGDLARVRKLLDQGADPNQQGWMGGTALLQAASRGHSEVVKLLLSRGGDPNQSRDHGITPLHWAATGEIAQLLLAANARVDAKKTRAMAGDTPLLCAKNAAVARVLLAHGAKCDAVNEFGETPLHKAPADVAALLLDAGVTIDRQDHGGCTPLHHAAFESQADKVRLLLDRGANPAIRNQAGMTPARYAEAYGRKATAELLRSSSGKTPQTSSAGPPSRLHRVRTHPDRPIALTAGDHCFLSLWSLKGKEASIEHSVSIAVDHIVDLSVIDDGRIVAVAGTGSDAIELRRIVDLSLVDRISIAGVNRNWLAQGICAFAASPNGRFFAVADSNEQVILYDRGRAAVASIVEGGERTHSLVFDPHSRYLAAACSFQGGGNVRIDRVVGSGELIPMHALDRSNFATKPPEFVDTLCALCFSPDGERLALYETSAIYHEVRPAGWRGDVVLFEIERGNPLWTRSIDAEVTGDRRSLEELGESMGFFSEVAFVTGNEIAFGASAGRVVFLETSTGVVRRVVASKLLSDVSSLAVSSDHLVWAAQAGVLCPVV